MQPVSRQRLGKHTSARLQWRHRNSGWPSRDESSVGSNQHGNGLARYPSRDMCFLWTWYLSRSYLEDCRRYNAVDRIRLRVKVSHGKFVVEEELEVGLLRLNVLLEDFVCAVVQWYWECVIKWDFYCSCVKSADRKQIVKTLSRLSHCWDLLPSDDYCKQIWNILFVF
jgi:hypothetical protein